MVRKWFVIASRFLAAAVVLAGAIGLAPAPVDAATITVLDQTVPGPVGGAKVCVDTSCQSVQGVANLHVRAALTTNSLIPPAVTTSSQPGCTANINIQVNVTSPGGSGSLNTTVEFDRTDHNGAVVGHTVLPLPSVPFSATSQSHSVSLCATLL